MGTHAEKTAQLLALFLWVSVIPGVPTCMWVIKADLTHYLDGYQQGGSYAGSWNRGQEKAIGPGSTSLLCAWPLARKHLTLFFGPSLHPVSRLSVCLGHDASLDVRPRMALTTSRAMRERTSGALSMEHGAERRSRLCHSGLVEPLCPTAVTRFSRILL